MENIKNSLPLLVEDMIFQTRNREYGAYVLRKTYNNRVTRSIIAAVIIFGLGVASPLIVDALSAMAEDSEAAKRKITEVDLLPPPPIDKNEPPPPPPVEPPPLKTTIKFLPPVVAPDEEVQEDPPKQEELEKADPGTKTQEGNDAGTDLSLLEGTNDKAKEVIEEKDEVFTVVEQMPGYPGGDEALLKYIKENVKYPAIARENEVQGTVYISYVVDKTGAVTNVRVGRGNVGGGCEEEAVRVIKTLPRYTPGKQNGRPASVSFMVPVKFRLAN